MTEDDEVQRRELERLLATAKDKDRQELILKAINALDEQDKMSISQEGQYKSMHYHGMSPSMHASLLMGENMPVLESVTLTPGGSARMRPMSARRRPSMPNLLDAIPETSKNHVANRNEEVVLPAEDIAEVVASSYDRRFPPKTIFRHSSNILSNNAHRDFNSIATSMASSAEHQQHQYHSSLNNSYNSNAGGHGPYTPELSAINTSGHSGGGYTLSANSSRNNSSSNLAGLAVVGSSSSSGAGGTHVVVPVAQRKSSIRNSNSNNINSNAIKGWVCSGMVPQFLHVSFFEKWEVKKIEVFCSGIERLAVQICPSAAAAMKTGAAATDMVHLGKGAFVWSAGGTEEDQFDNNVGGQPGISVTLIVRATNNLFLHISEIRIIAHPYT